MTIRCHFLSIGTLLSAKTLCLLFLSIPEAVAFAPVAHLNHRPSRGHLSSIIAENHQIITPPFPPSATFSILLDNERRGHIGTARSSINPSRTNTVKLNLHPSSIGLPAISVIPAMLFRFFQRGLMKFQSEYRTFMVIPLIAAFVGWFTNYLAVQMIFYPIKWRGIPIKRIENEPFGWIGWQGIVPAKTEKMTDSMVNCTLNQLLSMEDVILKLDPEKVADLLLPEVKDIIQPVINDVAPAGISSFVENMMNAGGGEWWQGIFGRQFLIDLTVDVQSNINVLLNIRDSVMKQMMSDRSLLGSLFQTTGEKELAFLTDSGLWFGFFLGVLQMIVALYFDNPWTLSIGGAIVGFATNWLALKWIFEPVTPTKFGPFTFQGKFLRRQKEVSTDFANFFSSRILTSKKLWNSILTDPMTAPTFATLFAENLSETAKTMSGGLLVLKDNPSLWKDTKLAVTRATKELPRYLGNLHPYVDETLELEETLRNGLQEMSSQEFERVLHPIFEEDELTLILAGAVLGFLAGLIQQGLASGALVLPRFSTILTSVLYRFRLPRLLFRLPFRIPRMILAGRGVPV